MKTHKKILAGLIGILLLVPSALVLVANKAEAAPSDPQPIRFYYDSCVDNAGDNNRGGRNCTFIDPNSLPNPDLLYGNGALEIKVNEDINDKIFFNVLYRDGGYSPNSPPPQIRLMDRSTGGLYFGGGSTGPASLSTFSSSGTVFTSPGYNILYRVYQSQGDADYKLLLAFRSDQKTPLVLALVNTKVQDDPDNDKRGTVYAIEIVQDVVMSAQSGSVTPPLTSTPVNEDSCEVLFYNPLTWIMCPVFEIVDGLARFLLDVFENLLSFTVNDRYDKSVKPAWSAIKNIVSALVVIVMLVMIFAQATSFGPFDAYTIRKLLPRIVAAVILIQLSWYLFSWVINTVNNIGLGLMDLFDNVFANATDQAGRPIELNNLWHLMSNAGIGSNELTFLSIVPLVAVGVAVVIALPLVMLVIFSALVAVAVGVAVLIFRLVLILVLLLTSPVALLAWVLPGTERYWKMWWDNFIKVLFMFPLIILIVEAGRIFAYVGGPVAYDTKAIGPFLALLIIVVGFFGPLFILPKTFRWGGSLMQMAGQGAFKAKGKLMEKPEGYFKARQQDWTEQRRRASVQRVADKVGYNKRRPWRYPMDKFRSGAWDPLKQVPGYRDVGQRSVEGYIQAGEEVYQKDVAAAEAKIVRERQQVRAQGGNHDAFLHAIADGAATYSWKDKDGNEHSVETGNRSDLEKVAARKQMATLGAATNWRYLESYYQKSIDPSSNMSEQERVQARKFFDDNVSTIIPKLPHIYTGSAAAADSNPGSIGQMHGVGIEAILSNLSQEINDPSDRGRITDPREVAGRKATAQKQLVTFLQNFQAAAANENIQLENGGLRAVKAFLDSTDGKDFKDQINLDPYDGRVTRNIPEVPESSAVNVDASARAELTALKTTLSDKIDPSTGYYNPQATTATRVVPGSGAGVSPQGVINIPHGSRSAEVVESGDVDIQKEVRRAGGWSNMSNPDLMRIYQYRTGSLKDSAEQELRNRGLFQ